MSVTQRIYQLLSHDSQNDRPFLYVLNPGKGTQSCSYTDLINRAEDWGAYYQQLGLRPRTPIAILLPHSIDLYCAFLGATFAGHLPALFAPPSIKFSQSKFFSTFELLLSAAQVGAVVASSELILTLPQGLQASALATLQLIAPESIISHKSAFKQHDVNQNDALYLQFSSGTTGIKKAVSISHQNLSEQIKAYANEIALEKSDTIISWLPLYHDMGMITAFWLPLLTKTPIVAISAHDWVLDPKIFVKAVSEYQGTLCWLPNFAFNHLAATVALSSVADASLSTLRGIVNCSEPIRAESLELFYRHFSPLGLKRSALWTSYAMAEATFALTSGRSIITEMVEGRAQVSSGTPLSGVEIQIVDHEIVVKAPWIVDGYYKNPSATEENFKNGWFYTGDLGSLSNNQLFVSGRKKDLIICRGANIYPYDLEQIADQIPGIIPGRSVALGVWNDTLASEDLVILAETKEAGAEARVELRAQLFEAISETIAVAPSDIRIVDHGFLEKSTSGKLARDENRKKYQELIKSEPDKISNIIKQLVHHHEIAPNQALISSGMIDSLGVAHLMVALEETFGIVIPDTKQWAFENFDSIDRISRLLAELRQGDKSVQRLGNSDRDREWKCKWFLNGRRDFDTLLLGSSRIMMLSAEALSRQGQRAYNFSVNNARTDDWICILQFVLEHNRAPLRRIYLGIDIEAFSFSPRDARLNHCTALAKYLKAPHIDPRPSENARLSEVLNNLKTAGQRLAAYSHEIEYGDMVYLEPPLLVDAFKTRQPLHIVDLGLASFKPEYKLRLANFDSLSPKALENFNNLIEVCRSQEIQLITFLPPLHPELEEFLRTETAYLDRISDLRTHLKSSGIHLYDYSLPQYYDGKTNDFIDAAHMGPNSADKLISLLTLQSNKP